MDRSRIPILFLTLLGAVASAPASAHDPLPNEWDGQNVSDVVNIGAFVLDIPALRDALAREPRGVSPPPSTIPSTEGRTAQSTICQTPFESDAEGPQRVSNGNDEYWTYPDPLYTCGVVERHIEYAAATRLARKICKEMSDAQNLWPPAIPYVTSPRTYVDETHHDIDGYRIEHGPLRGICVVNITAP